MYNKKESNKKKENITKNHNITNDFNYSPLFLSIKLKKSSKLENVQNSEEESTQNTINTILNNENNQSFKVKKSNKYNLELFPKKLNKAFNALEQLILDDNYNDEENKGENIKSICVEQGHRKAKTHKKSLKKEGKKNKKISILIPKLDFSDIFDYYNSNLVKIKEIGKNEKCDDEYGNIKKKFHYRKMSHHLIIEKYKNEI